MNIHRTTPQGKASNWRSTLALNEIIQRHLQGKTTLATHASPINGIPDAQEFIRTLRTFTEDIELTADGAVPYGAYTAFYWQAFNCMYAYIPEVDTAERYEGIWASIASVEEFVQEVQHSVWFESFQQDVEDYIITHPEFPFK